MAYRWEFDNLAREIDNLQNRAHEIGLHITGHALNRAKNACGWEFAGNSEQAVKATRSPQGSEVPHDND
jgi:hypothetical protein